MDTSRIADPESIPTATIKSEIKMYKYGPARTYSGCPYNLDAIFEDVERQIDGLSDDGYALYLLWKSERHRTAQLRTQLAKLKSRHKNLVAQFPLRGQSVQMYRDRLDALGWVWCNGGCEEGVRVPLTKEVVEAAELAVQRMRQWHNNHDFRRWWNEEATPEEQHAWLMSKPGMKYDPEKGGYYVDREV